jgi:hypothetical protein
MATTAPRGDRAALLPSAYPAGVVHDFYRPLSFEQAPRRELEPGQPGGLTTYKGVK